MGHCQMTLAVAGLKDDEITQQTKKLASSDWSDFPPAERLAYRFAHKLSREPQSLVAKDVAALTEVFGPERALDVLWHICWCNYMTRVADAFQLPLEPTNVFAPPAKKPGDGDKERR
jgi:alkylhydroperoxidase family enzyme